MTVFYFGDNMVEKLVEIGILFDFYGKLLTDRQYTAVELYYIHDLSLAEIGEELKISRQGVFDTLKRAEENLYEYENKLGLVKKFKDNKDTIIKIAEIILEIEKESKVLNNQKLLESVDRIRDLVRRIIDDV